MSDWLLLMVCKEILADRVQGGSLQTHVSAGLLSDAGILQWLLPGIDNVPMRDM